MLVKLLPEQIADNWESIKYALQDVRAPGFYEKVVRMNDILEALLADRLQCWFYFRENGDIAGLVITEIRTDVLGMFRHLLIFLLYAFVDSHMTEWASALETLMEYARASKCVGIEAFTDNEKFVPLATKLGFGQRIYLFKGVY